MAERVVMIRVNICIGVTHPIFPLPGFLALRPMNSPSRTTLENNGKIPLKPGIENDSNGLSGGEGGIRTHGTLARTTVFETAPFDRSGTSPDQNSPGTTGPASSGARTLAP